MKHRNRLAFGALVFALSAALAAPAMARDNDRGRGGHDRDHRGQYDRGRHDRGRDHRGRHDRDRRAAVRHYRAPPRHRYHAPHHRHLPPPRYVVRHHAPVYRRAPVYYAPPPPRWSRGVRYNHYGYGPTYVVHDYRYYGLRPPPRGHYWRRSDVGDFLLVAAATGIIADLILHR
jgi:Ni/Co efflux regulator RcnB